MGSGDEGCMVTVL